jgi:ribosome-associated toxin RatA of RatAB toxin-antitoxin module
MEVATETREIDALPATCYEVVVDLESYPSWASDIRSVDVIERDEAGRPVLAAFRAAAFGRSASYTLRYDHSKAPNEISWHQVSGDVTSRLDGKYTFSAAGSGHALVTYELEAELVVPLPPFVKRRAEVKIVHTALDDLARRIKELADSGPAKG